MSDAIHIGDVVTPAGYLEDGDGENTPRGTIAEPGDVLVVVDTSQFWDLWVSHAPVRYGDGLRCFGVRACEVRPLPDTCEPPPPPSFPADLFDEPAPEVAAVDA